MLNQLHRGFYSLIKENMNLAQRMDILNTVHYIVTGDYLDKTSCSYLLEETYKRKDFVLLREALTEISMDFYREELR